MANTNSPKPPPGSGPYGVTQVLAQSAVASANTAFTIVNPGFARSLLYYFTTHTFPGSGSSTANVALYLKDPATGGTYAVHAPGTARSSTGMSAYMLGQVTTSGSSAINCLVPRTMILQLSLSTGATSKDIVYSIGLEWLP